MHFQCITFVRIFLDRIIFCDNLTRCTPICLHLYYYIFRNTVLKLIVNKYSQLNISCPYAICTVLLMTISI
ncbi:hypothetical protein EB796_009146 [Bugula neritina]|uniref:Uncharacterized protein n=1 Tax=Bugula neritina TaxID=10212 RepID=A0A7J7K2Y2_BUGNE|nr:hypothetical protein EB796_009146 [Bugula neritina]